MLDPDHVPVAAVCVWPDCAVPVIEGATEFTRAASGVVTALVAAPRPELFVARTTTRTRTPRNAAPNAAVADVAPAMSTHDVPAAPHSCH